MTVAKKYDVEGPIGLQLNKKQYSRMVAQMDSAMQKAIASKKASKKKISRKKSTA